MSLLRHAAEYNPCGAQDRLASPAPHRTNRKHDRQRFNKFHERGEERGQRRGSRMRPVDSQTSYVTLLSWVLFEIVSDTVGPEHYRSV